VNCRCPASGTPSTRVDLLFDGPTGDNELATRLKVAPATVSLMVSDLSRHGILRRHQDDADLRRTIVSIAEQHHAAVNDWLSKGAHAWRTALEPLTPALRRTVIETLQGAATASARRAGPGHTIPVSTKQAERAAI
jgi:DNA-binding MarR family transcriptional regulator